MIVALSGVRVSWACGCVAGVTDAVVWSCAGVKVCKLSVGGFKPADWHLVIDPPDLAVQRFLDHGQFGRAMRVMTIGTLVARVQRIVRFVSVGWVSRRCASVEVVKYGTRVN